MHLMQDGAGGHTARATIAVLNAKGIFPVMHPALSPDLNPIETVWNWMKDYIQEKYGSEVYRSYPWLRAAVIEAWNSITDEEVINLVKDMHNRCQAVIDAKGCAYP